MGAMVEDIYAIQGHSRLRGGIRTSKRTIEWCTAQTPSLSAAPPPRPKRSDPPDDAIAVEAIAPSLWPEPVCALLAAAASFIAVAHHSLDIDGLPVSIKRVAGSPLQSRVLTRA